MNRFILAAREKLLSEDPRKCSHYSEDGPLKCAIRKKAFLPLNILREECTFLIPSFSWIAPSLSPSAQLWPSFWLGSAARSFLQTSSASFLTACWSGSCNSWQRITRWPCDLMDLWHPSLATSSCVANFIMWVEALLGSMDCVNEYSFATNPSLMIDEHMYFSFTCPYISVIIFCHTPTFCFLCAYQETDPAGLAVNCC